MEATITEEFTCKNCGEVAKESDYGEMLHLYKSLKEQGLCETCAKMSKEDRKEYAMGIRLATVMIKNRGEKLDKDVERLEVTGQRIASERKALEGISAKEMALEALLTRPLEAKPKSEQE